MPSWAPRPVPTISAVGVARPSAHGQAMISTATAAVNAAAGLPPTASQPPRVARASTITTGHEDRGDPVGQPLHRGLAVLRLLDQPGHPGQLGVGADPGGLDDQPAAGVHGGAGDRVARADLDRHRLAGEHARRRPPSCPRRTMPSVAIFSPGRTTNRSPTASCATGIRILAPVAQHGDVLGAQLQQRPQRRPGPPLGAGLEVAAEQDEGGDAGGGLQVERGAASAADGERNSCVIPASRVPKNSAQTDQPKAASVPSETRVSMVAAPCRRLVQAARWNGRPP